MTDQVLFFFHTKERYCDEMNIGETLTIQSCVTPEKADCWKKKTLREKENILVNSNFSFSNDLFCRFKDKFHHSNPIKYLVCIESLQLVNF